MRKIIKGRWSIFAIWLVATILLTVFQPDVNAILIERGQQPLSSDSPSEKASHILSKMEPIKGTDNLIVFHEKNKLTNDDLKQIQEGINAILDSKQELGINKIIDPFSMPEAKGSLISKDETTLMVSFKLEKGKREVDDIQKEIEGKLTNIKADHYLTGVDFIQNDYMKVAISGVDKSAKLTVIFILVVLIIMFRSVLTPIISLLAVGFSYLCSMGIAAQLIDKANFPITSLTQMLLVLILFGIGTDYNILLFNRFKEELAKGYSIDDSIIHTYKTAGKTIAYSILTVFVAFAGLVFAKSPIYQSGVVVVIGVSILLLEILTLTPFVMKVLGTKLFWPSKKINGHGENKFWGASATFATKHPILSVIIILLLTVPTIVLHEQKLNFDSIGALGDSTGSSKGFKILSEHFGKGQAMPATVAVESSKSLDNNESLKVVESLTENIKKLKGVKQVSSVTQPEGKKIDQFYVSGQMVPITDGMSKTKDGVDQINGGLKLAAGQLRSADFSKVSQMVDGTAKLESGVVSLSAGLEQIQKGISDGTTDSKNIRNGIASIQTNLTAMSSGLELLSQSYSQMQSGYTQIGANYQQIAQSLLDIKGALIQMQPLVNSLGANNSSDSNYQLLKGTLDTLIANLNQITPEGIQALNTNYNAVTDGFSTANQNLAQMSAGLNQMSVGLKQLEEGLNKASSVMGVIVTNMKSVASGLDQMKVGQVQLTAGLNGFSVFGQKLTEVNNGLSQISDGLGQTNNFLTQLNENKSFFMPKEVFSSKDFQKVFHTFMSENRKITKIMVILDDDPYSPAALNTINKINKIVSGSISGTVLSHAKVGVAGPSAATNDLNKILNDDLDRMTIIVIVGIFLVLMLVVKNGWESAVITASLWVSYYVAIFVMNYIFLNLKGLPGVDSFVPFFSFIIIVSLGVDYSIFLMMRFKEYPHLSHKEAIVLASKHIGGVVISAVIILGGTFATLIPSGFAVLVQLAVAVIAGLVVLCFILLPTFLPAMIALPSALSKLFSSNKKVASEENVA